jgi:hypothetical protein
MKSVNQNAIAVNDDEIQLDLLRVGTPGVTPAQGTSCEEACLVCFADQGHPSGVTLSLRGLLTSSASVTWPQPITPQIKRAHADLQDATEEAACGVAFLLLMRYTPYTVVERSYKGTGFDYWAGFDLDDEISTEARLEVSGILKCNTESYFSARVRQKIEQVSISAHLKMPAYVIIVDFGEPKAHMEVI